MGKEMEDLSATTPLLRGGGATTAAAPPPNGAAHRRRRTSFLSQDAEYWYAGESHVQWLEPTSMDLESSKSHEPKHELLGEWTSTAISGNDITSSCFYAISLCAAEAGIYTPVSLFLVVLLLYCFRSVYGEVGTALPLNGGCYTLLLNVSVRGVAAFAAGLTLLSYVATAVVSADSAVNYILSVPQIAARLDPEESARWVEIGTISVLGFFALLSLLGVTESAIVAFLIFAIHMTTIFTLMIASLIYFLRDPSQLIANWESRGFNPTVVSTNPILAVLYGFSGALLGVTGFETSANFIEQQKKGVFPKTLRNMWVCVLLINPLMGFLALCLLPINQVANAMNTSLLASMGKQAAGNWLETLISIDAGLVLAGAVLTSYVGVLGLIRRLALDRCMPMFFIAENKWRRTNHWTILTFFGICTSLYELLTNTGPADQRANNFQNLSKVYTVAFLCVMSLFALGNMILKYKRSRLPRTIRAKWPVAIVSMIGVVTGLFLALNVQTLEYFFLYYGITLFVIGVMFLRIRIIKFIIYAVHGMLSDRFGDTPFYHRILERLRRTSDEINKQAFVFFSSTGDLAHLNKAVLYVRENEQTQILKIVHVYEDESKIPSDIEENVKILDRCFPKMRIDFVGVKGSFSPEIVDYVSYTLAVPKNLMFIACPGRGFPHDVATLGGVRVITTFTVKKGLRIANNRDEEDDHHQQQTGENGGEDGVRSYLSQREQGDESPLYRVRERLLRADDSDPDDDDDDTDDDNYDPEISARRIQ
eukprot:TRINITY_DN1293_c0_g5_i1.p1 TRINITY_DN1293_c0_g5~~TRINITY_DN1293_c0_g5_i1.p1  ORF type:complete len:763 (+),score=176.39 TRINITY_DN1293_c0_g5_i1:252-2540(+)